MDNNLSRTASEFSVDSMNLGKLENQNVCGLPKRIYDEGQGLEFNKLLRNPKQIKAMKVMITEDDEETMVKPEESLTKTYFDKTMRQDNTQDKLSITGFKVIEKLPPTGGETQTSANKMIDRFRVSTYKSEFSNTGMSKTKSKFNMPLEPKLSRPTTTITNQTVRDMYNRNKDSPFQMKTQINKDYFQKKKEKENEEEGNEDEEEKNSFAAIKEEIDKENEELAVATETQKEEAKPKVEENEEDQFMNQIHQFIRQAFEQRDSKMDFVYFLPSDNENFYDLQPKDFADVAKKKNYYTLSSKGLTVYIDKKPKEFIKLAEWINERDRYNFIEKIPFFHNFKIWRILKMWRKNIFKQKKIAYQNELQSSLLFNNKDYNAKLVEHKSYCNRLLAELKILDITVGMDALSYKQFLDKQEFLRETTKNKIKEVHDLSEKVFKKTLKAIFTQVQERINQSNNNENHSGEEEKQGQMNKTKAENTALEGTDLSGDKGGDNDDEIVGYDNYKYKDKMLVKDECKNFVKLAYLFDYIMLDVLRRIFLFSMEEVIEKLKEYNARDVPKMKENLPGKSGEFIKPPVSNINRLVSYISVECRLNPKFDPAEVENKDKIKSTVKQFFVKATPDDEFDPSAHIMIDTEEQEYQRLLSEGKNPQDIMTNVQAGGGEIEITKVNEPSKYFLTFEPTFEQLASSISKEINDNISTLKLDGWRAHPKFKNYLKYMDDWDEKFGEWDSNDFKEINVTEILRDDLIYITKEKTISEQVAIAKEHCEDYLTNLDPYLQLHWKQLSIKKEILLDEYLKDADEMFRLIFVFSEKSKRKLEQYIPYDEEIGMIKLSLENGLRKDLSKAQNKTIEFLEANYPQKLKERERKLSEWIEARLKDTEGEISDVSVFLKKNKTKEILDVWYDINERKLNAYLAIGQLLRSKNFSEISAEDIKAIEASHNRKFQLKVKWDQLTENLNRTQDKLYTKVQKDLLASLNADVNALKGPLLDEKFVSYDANTKVENMIKDLADIEKKFKIYESTAKTYDEFLVTIGQNRPDFSLIEEIKEILETLQELWNAFKDFNVDIAKWRAWKFDDFIKIEVKKDNEVKKIDNVREILDKLEEYEGKARKTEGNVASGSATKKLIADVETYTNAIKVVSYLHTDCLKVKSNPYLEKINNLFDVENASIYLVSEYTLEFLMDKMGIQDKEEQICKIKTEAVKYQELDKKISDIIIGIKDVKIFLGQEKKTVQNDSEIITKLEDLQSQVNIVAADRYAVRLFGTKGPKSPITIKNEIEKALNQAENIKIFQKKYRYLESILNAGDMKRKLQDNTFDKADSEWRSKLNKPMPPDHLKRLKELSDVVANQMRNLESTQMQIEEQLTFMRINFERFYFISNDDLLYMLSNSKNSENKEDKDTITKIKPYLSKIFEDLYELKVVIKEKTMNTELSSIYGLAKEELQLKTPVRVEEDLEKWIKLLRDRMYDTLKEKMIEAFKTYAEIDGKEKAENKKWIENYTVEEKAKGKDEENIKHTKPNLSQIVATVTHAKFVAQTEKEIKEYSKTSNTLAIWLGKIDKIITAYSEMVNEDVSMKKNTRRVISNLITHYVHYKDIVEYIFNNCDFDVTNESFDWQKQLRIYFEPEGGVALTEANYDRVKFDVKIKQLNFVYEYGYEYFGPSTRLVISPLTDRVWMTMTSGLHIKMGCSLGGPAGTGKTETTKDLAKFLGIQCIVFNCSDQIDYKILGNIFSGLCLHKTGAFACLDEFNRISEEVLSVVATQLFKIRQAQLAGGDSKGKKVAIMTDEIELIGKGGVFVTMNPTYSGRTELPDNLKANFRPITMMKPEFAKIAQVKLFSEGFRNANVLSRKLQKLYELAEQQLSRQDHYDFTLRTLGTVLSMAGNLKRTNKSIEERAENTIVLTALRDANFPKFINDDIKLFSALLSDLFPNNELKDPDHSSFDEELKNVIMEEGYSPSPFTMKKCYELLEIMNIRLGICLTGPAGTGKTTIIQLVEDVSTKIQKANPKCDPKYKNVRKWIINPKSITMGELFGEENEEKKTFEYGIATKKIKKALKEEAEENYRWVILDGPIDTKWIENMNSVLDDSQTLCLANGERIKLKSHVKVLFEVEDLSKASLATVSRLGVIYLGPTDLGWYPYMDSWVKRYFKDETILPEELIKYVRQIFEDKMDDAIDSINDLAANGNIYNKPSIACSISSLCSFLEFYITREHGFVGKEMKELDNQDVIGKYKKKIIMCFALSMVWGVFGCVSSKAQNRVESFIRNRFGEIKMESNQGIMDYYYDFEKEDYVEYNVDEKNFIYDKEKPYYSIFVPTLDSFKYSEVLKILIGNRKHIYVTGDTGSGKTAVIQSINKELLETEEWTLIPINFSAQTSSIEAQQSFESKLEQKKGRKNLWGKGGKKCLVFIDDINMPEPNEWGAHPPIELLRQFLDKGGLYDRPGLYWKNITNTNMIVAGGPPVGGRSDLTSRFTRHFSIICFPIPAKNILNYIFENILKGFFLANNFSEQVKKYTIETTSSTMELYEDILVNLKPIPSKFHYIYNLRDISRVFQGILTIRATKFNDPQKFVRLWINEVQRVFCDRLINEEDVQKVKTKICELVKSKFKMEWSKEDILSKHYFGEVHKGVLTAGNERAYEEIDSLETLRKKLKDFVETYNSKNKNDPIKYVFFEYFIEHILRICRVLRQPKGHVVLIGHGGSGKQSVCKISSFIMTNNSAHFETFTVSSDLNLKKFKPIIKEIIKRAGCNKKCLLLNDNNVCYDFILENINSFLNNGEIPNLLEGEYNTAGDDKTTFESYEQFVEITSNNLHILFCTSPVGDLLRLRMRRFPALMNCCSLDWFMPWPTEALFSCCTDSFESVEIMDADTKKKVVDLLVESHVQIEQLKEDFYNELGRKVYVTPKTFLDMVSLLIDILKTKKEYSQNRIDILDNGTKKLESTQEDIGKLGEVIEKLIPQIAEQKADLEVKTQEINEKREETRIQSEKCDQSQKLVTEAKRECQIMLNNINEKRDVCKEKFKEIKKNAEDNLSENTIANFKNEKAIGLFAPVKQTLLKTVANLLFEGEDEKNNEKEKSYAFQIKDNKSKLSEIDKYLKEGPNQIPDKKLENFKKNIREVIPKLAENYKPEIPEIEEKFKKNSETQMYMYRWCNGVIDLWEKEKEIRPLEKESKTKTEEKDKLTAELEALKKTKAEKEQELDKLNKESQRAQETLEKLETDSRENQRRMNNAKTLLESLKDERERWIIQLANLRSEQKNFLGNYLLSSLFISYLSPFTGYYRKLQLNKWMDICKKEGITFSNNFQIKDVMSDEVEIRQWSNCGLPSDSVSIENAIMITNNTKFALLIDPQLQGNQWLKKFYKNQDLRIYKADLKPKDKNADKSGDRKVVDRGTQQLEELEKDLMDGKLALLENCAEEIDSVYAPIIGQNYYDDGLELKISFNGKNISYAKSFKMFFTTKIANPHYPPEFFIKLNIINFTVTQSGLSEQLLSEVFKSENKEKFQERGEAIDLMGKMKDELATISAKILKQLAEISQDKILDSEELIVSLNESKEASEEVNQNMDKTQRIDRETSQLRDSYIPVARRGSILFFVVADMCKIDPMYQFSLVYFKKIFNFSISYKEENSETPEERVKFLVKKVTEDIFKNIKRGLFEAHKSIFSFLISTRILQDEGVITEDEWNFFVKGASNVDSEGMPANPDSKYFSEYQWKGIFYFENKFKFDNFSSAISSRLDDIKKFYSELEELGDKYNTFLDDTFNTVKNIDIIKDKRFLKLVLIKLFKPEKLTYFAKRFVADELGEVFIDTTATRLEEVYKESDWKTPIIFILSKGADPTNDFINFKEKFQALRVQDFEIRRKKMEEELERAENQEAENPEGGNNGENNQEGQEAGDKEAGDNEGEAGKEDEEEGEEKKEEEKKEEDKEEAVAQNQENNDQEDTGEFPHIVISLGQGQEENARKAISDIGMKKGGWVLLSNCHLFKSFMQELANIVQNMQENTELDSNKNFRLWLTSMPSQNFPVSILQNSLKLTTEPPTGIKANMKKLFEPITDEQMNPIVKPEPPPAPDQPKKTAEEIQKEEEEKKKDFEVKKFHLMKLSFALTLFHSVLQERKKFGPIGFNMRYDFNQSDFNTSSEFSRMYISEGYLDEIPLDSIIYLIGEVTYGGSITDETDRLVMNKTLSRFINYDLFEKLRDSNGDELEDENELVFGKYTLKSYKNLIDYRKYIPTLPNFDDPDIFGLNQNANIVYELKESNALLDQLSKVMSRGQGGGSSNVSDDVMELITGLINNPIELIDIKSRHKTHDKLYDNELRHSLTIVLFQEVEKYNKLILKMNSSLIELKKAIEGTSVMSPESEEIYGSLLLNKIPTSWSKIGYSCFKPFASWLTDLQKRVQFITSWLVDGVPPIFWISGLFYPQGFVTGIFQTHARENKIPVNDIVIDFHVLKEKDEEIKKGPKQGVYVNGLYLEGATWSHEEGLIDQKPGEMWTPVPTIWFETKKFVPKNDDEDDEDSEDDANKMKHYLCPMFKTSRRAQIISSSGSSLEKVIDVQLDSKMDENYWILRGAAIIMQLDD